jgi:hypothetical protein
MTDVPLESNKDYYIALYLNENPISFTNRFSTNSDNIYEVDLFSSDLVVPFNMLVYHEQSVMLVGFNYPSMTNIKIFDTIYYKRSDAAGISMNSINSIINLNIVYHDSCLARDIRKYYVGLQKDGIDNILRFASGMCSLAYVYQNSVLNMIYNIINLTNWIKQKYTTHAVLVDTGDAGKVCVTFANGEYSSTTPVPTIVQ